MKGKNISVCNNIAFDFEQEYADCYLWVSECLVQPVWIFTC